MQEGVHDLFPVGQGAVIAVREKPHIFRKPVKITGISDLTKGKPERFREALFFFVRQKMDPIVIVAGFIAAVMDVGVGRKADQGIGCNLPAPAVYDRPGFLFDQQDEIIGHTCAVFNVAGAVVVGIVAAAVCKQHSRSLHKKAE